MPGGELDAALGLNGVKMESTGDGVGAQSGTSGGGIASGSKGLEAEEYYKVSIHYFYYCVTLTTLLKSLSAIGICPRTSEQLITPQHFPYSFASQSPTISSKLELHSETSERALSPVDSRANDSSSNLSFADTTSTPQELVATSSKSLIRDPPTLRLRQARALLPVSRLIAAGTIFLPRHTARHSVSGVADWHPLDRDSLFERGMPVDQVDSEQFSIYTTVEKGKGKEVLQPPVESPQSTPKKGKRKRAPSTTRSSPAKKIAHSPSGLLQDILSLQFSLYLFAHWKAFDAGGVLVRIYLTPMDSPEFHEAVVQNLTRMRPSGAIVWNVLNSIVRSGKAWEGSGDGSDDALLMSESVSNFNVNFSDRKAKLCILQNTKSLLEIYRSLESPHSRSDDLLNTLEGASRETREKLRFVLKEFDSRMITKLYTYQKVRRLSRVQLDIN